MDKRLGQALEECLRCSRLRRVVGAGIGSRCGERRSCGEPALTILVKSDVTKVDLRAKLSPALDAEADFEVLNVGDVVALGNPVGPV